MHFCMNELLVLSMLLNTVQTSFLIKQHYLILEARRVARKLKQKLLDRPIRTIVYANGEKHECS